MDPAATRPAASRRAVIVSVFVVTAVVVAVTTSAWAMQRLSGLRQVSLGGAAQTPATGQNYLIVGSDSRAGVSPNDPDFASMGDSATTSGQRSDTIMVLHVQNGQAKLLSLPRDLYVTIAGTGHKDRINSAYAHGPDVLVRTITADLNIPISHYLEVNFQGFKRLVDALGGIELCYPTAMGDPTTGFNFAIPGCHMINGVQALQFTRSRHMRIFNGKTFVEDPTGDLGRIKRQQEFMKRTIARLSDVVARDPLAVGRVIDALVANVTVDDQLGRSGLLSLATQLRSVGGSGLAATTFPVTPKVIAGADVLIADMGAAGPTLREFGAGG